MESDYTFEVMTSLMDRPVSGLDSMIIAAPPEVFTEVDGQRVISMPDIIELIGTCSEMGARNLGERLHHAHWVLTTDPEVVASKGLAHDCTSCRAGLDQSLARLREFPEEELFVGTLYWADMS